MLLMASSIHDESKKPLKFLRKVPSEGWLVETQRLSQQIQNNHIALTGKKFFSVTRGIIITIAGTILTYELVLLQFGAAEIISNMFNPCPHNYRPQIHDQPTQNLDQSAQNLTS